jgi:hypothetical protein
MLERDVAALYIGVLWAQRGAQRAHRPEPTDPPTPNDPDGPDDPDSFPDPDRLPGEPIPLPIGDPPPQPFQNPQISAFANR